MAALAPRLASTRQVRAGRLLEAFETRDAAASAGVVTVDVASAMDACLIRGCVQGGLMTRAFRLYEETSVAHGTPDMGVISEMITGCYHAQQQAAERAGTKGAGADAEQLARRQGSEADEAQWVRHALRLFADGEALNARTLDRRDGLPSHTGPPPLAQLAEGVGEGRAADEGAPPVGIGARLIGADSRGSGEPAHGGLVPEPRDAEKTSDMLAHAESLDAAAARLRRGVMWSPRAPSPRPSPGPSPRKGSVKAKSAPAPRPRAGRGYDG